MITHDGYDLRLGTQALLSIMSDQWHQVFKKAPVYTERSYVSEMRETRNLWVQCDLKLSLRDRVQY